MNEMKSWREGIREIDPKFSNCCESSIQFVEVTGECDHDGRCVGYDELRTAVVQSAGRAERRYTYWVLESSRTARDAERATR